MVTEIIKKVSGWREGRGKFTALPSTVEIGVRILPRLIEIQANLFSNTSERVFLIPQSICGNVKLALNQ